jgi:hypothetical protein
LRDRRNRHRQRRTEARLGGIAANAAICSSGVKILAFVFPAHLREAGIRLLAPPLDSRLRGNERTKHYVPFAVPAA